MPNPPSPNAVRTQLATLQEKGHVQFVKEGVRHIYEPATPTEEIGRNAIADVVRNFFGGSVERVVATLVDPKATELSDADLARLQEIIEEARRQGK